MTITICACRFNGHFIIILHFQALEGQHGSMLALGYLIGEIYHRKRGVSVQDMETDTIEDAKLEDAFVIAVKAIGRIELTAYLVFKISMFE